jgi:hypothetical protein
VCRLKQKQKTENRKQKAEIGKRGRKKQKAENGKTEMDLWFWF